MSPHQPRDRRRPLLLPAGSAPESLLVLYLGDDQAVQAATARLGVEPVTPANPYWAEHGITVADPDGFRVVLVPGRWPS